MSQVRIAIIGCGWAGQRHAASCKALGIPVTWTVDTVAHKAEACQDAYDSSLQDTRVTKDYLDVLRDSRTNAVSLCLPHDLHAPYAIQAMEAGKHVLVEKPLAADLSEADQMIQAAKQAGVILMVAENVRFNPIYLKIDELLQAGLIGDPAVIHITRQAYLRDSFLRDRTWFLDAVRAAGGIMMSGGIHDFETMRMLIGDVESVYSLRAPQRFTEMEGDDTSAALIRFRNGVVGMLFESFISKCLTTAAGPEVHTLRIEGSLGSISWSGGNVIRLFSEKRKGFLESDLTAHDIHVSETDTFQAILTHFVHCVTTGQEPVTSGAAQRHALAAVKAAYRSMVSGQPEVIKF